MSVRLHGEGINQTLRVSASMALLFILGATGCTEKNKGFRDRPEGRTTFGELIYSIVEDNLGTSSSCREPMLEELTAHRTSVITSIDATLPP